MKSTANSPIEKSDNLVSVASLICQLPVTTLVDISMISCMHLFIEILVVLAKEPCFSAVGASLRNCLVKVQHHNKI